MTRSFLRMPVVHFIAENAGVQMFLLPGGCLCIVGSPTPLHLLTSDDWQ